MIKEHFFIEDIEIINFANLDRDDILEVFRLRNHPEISKWMFHKNFSLQEHFNFIETLKKDKTKFFYLLKQEGIILGVVSLVGVDFLDKKSYAGIYKNPIFSKVGDKILAILEIIAFERMQLKTIILEVFSNNYHAISCYERNGYIKCKQNSKEILIYEKHKL